MFTRKPLENAVALTVSAELQKAVSYKGLWHVSAPPVLPGNHLSPLWLICIFEAAMSEVDFVTFRPTEIFFSHEGKRVEKKKKNRAMDSSFSE